MEIEKLREGGLYVYFLDKRLYPEPVVLLDRKIHVRVGLDGPLEPKPFARQQVQGYGGKYAGLPVLMSVFSESKALRAKRRREVIAREGTTGLDVKLITGITIELVQSRDLKGLWAEVFPQYRDMFMEARRARNMEAGLARRQKTIFQEVQEAAKELKMPRIVRPLDKENNIVSFHAPSLLTWMKEEMGWRKLRDR